MKESQLFIRHRSLIVAATSALTLAAPSVHAASGTWTGGSATPNWGFLANWVSSTEASGTGFTATFGNTFNNGYEINLNASRTIGNITLNGNATSDFVINQINSSSFTFDVTSGSPTVNVTDVARTLSINVPIGGADGMTKSGPGSLVLSDTNTFTGNTLVVAGTLNLTGNRVANMAGTLDIGGTDAILNLSGDLPMAASQFRPGNGTGIGTVNQTAGAVTFTSGNQLTLGTNAATEGYYNLSGGSFTTAPVANRGMILGVNANCVGTFTLSDSGVLDVVSGSSLQIGRTESGQGVDNATGTFIQTGGIATISDLRMGGGNPGNSGIISTLDVSAGTFTAASIPFLSVGDSSVSTINISGTAEVTLPDLPTTRGAGATATITFDGGTLKNGVPSSDFLGGLTEVLIKAGGATFDTGAGAATIIQDLSEDGSSIGGGLSKVGAADLILAGMNTYTGATNANEGSLKFTTAVPSATDLVVADSAAGGVLVAVDDGQWQNSGDLTCDNNSAVVIDYGTSIPSTTIAPISVDNFNVGSNLGLKLEGVEVPNMPVSTAYPLVTWTTSGPSDGSAFTSILVGGLSGTFSVSSNTLFLTVTSNTVGQPISWNTGNGIWDTVTTNWVNASLASVAYNDPLDGVLFGDAAGATGNPIITLDSVLSPVGVTMNSASHDYTITGTGGIGGLDGLTLDAANTGTLALTTANTYLGATTIDGGTLQLGNGGSDGSLSPSSAISVAAGATFAVNQDDTVTQGTDFAGTAIDGAGGFSQAGSGTTVLNAANTFSGPTSISVGTLQIDGAGSLGGGSYAGDIAISGGAALQYSSSAAQTLSGIISGAGSLIKDTGNGALTLSGPNEYTGDTTLVTGTLTLGASEVIGDSSVVLQDGGTINTADGVIETLHSLSSIGGKLLFGPTNTSGSADIILLNDSEVNNIEVGITGILRLAPGVTLTQGVNGTISQLGSGDSLTFDVGTGGFADITGDINTGDGDGAINKTGSGILTLTSGASKWGGGTVIEDGTLEFTSIANYNNASSLGDGDNAGSNNAIIQIGSDATSASLKMIGTDVANSSNRALTLGDAGGIIDVDDVGQTLTLSGIVSDANTSGDLTKAGDGTLVLSGLNTYSGGTLVSAGALKFSTDGSGVSDITVAANASAGPLVATNDAQFISGGDLTFENDGTLVVDYGSTTPSNTFAPLQVDNFVLGTNPSVILEAASISSLVVGQTYPLITWTGSGPIDGSAFSLVSHRGLLSGIFSVAANTLSVEITANTPPIITWNEGDGIWDAATDNWLDPGLAATAYVDPLDGVSFGDASGVSGNPAITLDSLFTPLSVTMNSTSHDYSISGSGGIAGSGALTLDAANTRILTLATANDSYTGDITVNGGTLIGAGEFSGSGGVRVFGAGTSSRTVTVNAGGTLQFDSGNIFSGNFTSNNVPSLVINGGTVTNGGIATNNALGLVALNGGTLTATTGSTSGYGTYNLNGTVTSNGTSLISSTASVPFTLSAATGTTTTFDVQSGTLTVSAELGEVTASGDERFSGLTKIGPGTLVLSNANTYSQVTTIDEGVLEFTTSQALTGGLTFGSTAGSTTTGALDLSAASATFGGPALVQTNNAVANMISIGASQSLALNGGLTMGYDAGGGTGATESNLTVSGAGSLAITGTTITISVNQAGTNRAYWSAPTLDVSGLAEFSADVTSFNIGVGSTTQGPGTVLLSDTANTIIATTLTAGNTGGNNGRGSGLLVLGTGTNVIQADTITIGRSKSVPGGATGVIRFASQDPGSPGTVIIADKAGTGRADIDIANQAGTATGGGATGNLDLRGHVATVSAGTVSIGSVISASNSGGPNGTLSFDGGTFDVNTLTMGTKSGNSTGTARATVNVGGGDFTVNTAFTLGSHSGNGASVATVNLTGGTFTSNTDIVDGGGNTTSTINLSGGTLDMAGNDIGTSADAVVLTLESGTLQNVGSINGSDGLTKTTTGTLVLGGVNAYGGATIVSEGTLALGANDALPDGSDISLAAATLDAVTFTDVAGTLDVADAAKINLGGGAVLSFADSSAIDWTGGALEITGTFVSGSSIRFGTDANGLLPDQLALIGSAGFGAFSLDASGFLTAIPAVGYDAWKVANAGGQGPDLDFDNDGVPNGVEFFMNAAPGFTANPSIDGSGTITWPNGGNILASAYGSEFVIQTSSDLSDWQDVDAVALTTNTDGPGGELTYTLTGAAPRFVRLKVTPN